MFLAMAGAMSTAEIGLSLAEMIRQDKFSFVCCSANNLEEDIMNLVAHSHYYRIPGYRDLTPQQEQELLENHYNRVTDTCIPEEEAFRRLEGALTACALQVKTVKHCQDELDAEAQKPAQSAD